MIPASFAAGALRILGLIIPVPLVVILAALAWLHLDKASAIRRAVDAKVTELVAGARIASLNAQIAAERQITLRMADLADERERRLRVALSAQLALAERLAVIRTEKEGLDDDLADLLARPVDRACAVDADLARGLRSR